MGREPKLLVAVGKKGCGKSFTTKKMMYQYAQGNPVKGVPPRRVLILDVNDEFTEFPSIAPSDVALFSVHPRIEIRRIRPFHQETGKKMTLDDIANTLFFVLDNYRNGMLLVEDINKYISDTMPNDLIGAICTNRHIGVDIMIHYQSIGRITSKVWQNLNIIRMHKITDYVKRHKHKFEDKFEYISIAELLVNKRYESGDKHFFVYIDVDDEKVYGAFTKKEFEDAVDVFIQNNYNILVKPMLDARDAKGNLVYNPETAIKECKRKLMNHHKG